MPEQLEAILEQISLLNADDRLLLEQRLRDLAEVEWRTEADEARAIARVRGVDQQAIDDAIDDVRYGS